jgi:peptide/nickel transport system permease protein
MMVVLYILSVVVFIIVQLPPGDYVTTYISELETQQGMKVEEEEIIALRKAYGVDQPMYVQYFKWMGKLLHGNFGMSLHWQRPVIDLLAERIPPTLLICILATIFTYAVGIPIGIYSAIRQYSIGDYSFTVLGFIGLATPNFLLALILMFLFYKYFGLSVGGLFSMQYTIAPWSVGKFVDLLKHLPIPVIVIGTPGAAGLIRTMRGCLLDELRKQYVITARAKGVAERTLLFKYPVRVAINPIISTIGWTLPWLVSGGTITEIVLSLPTTGPLLFEALLKQDMELAGSTLMFLSFLTVIGTFLSDILLVLLDPRIRYEKKA